MDEMPLAYCVIELVFDEDGHGVDFIFRYCNKEMAVVEGVPVEESNRSFYEVFRNGDRKWLVSYADVALNGTKHTLKDFSPGDWERPHHILLSARTPVSVPASCCQNKCTT